MYYCYCYYCYYYYYYYYVRIKTIFTRPVPHKKRRHRSNIKFYHIPYRIAREKIIASPISQLPLPANLQNKMLIYYLRDMKIIEICALNL